MCSLAFFFLNMPYVTHWQKDTKFAGSNRHAGVIFSSFGLEIFVLPNMFSLSKQSLAGKQVTVPLPLLLWNNRLDTGQ